MNKTMAVIYYDQELEITLEFISLLDLAEWLELPAFEIVNVIDYGKKFEGWSAWRKGSPH